MTWEAPAGFVPAPSAAEGIRWFAPPTEALSRSRCARCGGHAVDGRCPVCAAEVAAGPEWPASRTGRWCRSCGSRWVVTVAVTCPTCGSQAEASELLEGPPSHVVPFTVGPEACQRAVARWLGGGWFHPWRLGRLLRAGALHPVFVPVWVVEGSVDAEWRGRVGQERVERVFDPTTRAWSTQTRVDWRWQTGRLRERAARVVPATTRLPARALEAVRLAFDPDEAVPFDAAPGEPGLEPEVLLGAARAQGRRALRAEVRDRCRSAVSGPLIRDLSVTEDLAGESWRLVWVPAYVGSWWDGDVRRVVVCHGRTAEVVGERPVDWRRVRLVVVLALLPGALAVLAGIPLLLVFAVGVPTMLFGLVALALGSAVSVVAWSAALASETG